MESDICVNTQCGVVTEHEWKKGWLLRSGGFAKLCDKCGSAYENSAFCKEFHLEESGWRECNFCKKAIHCGCIVSKSLFEYLDFGGIGCISCVKSPQLHLMQNSITSAKNIASERPSLHIDGRIYVDSVHEGKLMQLCKIVEASESSHWSQVQRDGILLSSGQNSQEVKCPTREVDAGFSNPSLCMSLGTPSGNSVLPSAGEIVDGRVEEKPSPFHQGQRSRPILPKPPKTGLTINQETSKGVLSHPRIARPPAEARGKNQLLPRYWPRLTDKELEQWSGDLKSAVVPLFEKVLSASDAGRIGRLVLPKACAEAYFPPISQSEGLPLRIQDVKGHEWTFQFRFWPNNNSRMYVLEGVTPCIQSMQLRAGDTVIFSRIDPGGKLVIGFRKASNSLDTQDASTSAPSNGISMKDTSCSGVTDNLHSGNSYPVPPQLVKVKREAYSNGLSEHLHLNSMDAGSKSGNYGSMTNNDSLQQPISVSEKKRTRNIGSKSKRLLIRSEDSMELRLTWEEAQDLLRPPPSVKPSIVTIEDHVFEEYDEPPVFGKRTFFTTHSSGRQDQWAQCDDCCKWRRLPVDVLLPPKWTCSENEWDDSRSLCSAPEELIPKELENLLRTSKGFKKKRIAEDRKSPQEHEISGLDALASLAVLGENFLAPSESTAGITTKHPRHRPGCTCIVCIQPPSGKGRHKPSCTCNVCMTVKRRFKTLMMRKKKRQSEREADATEKEQVHHQRDESETNGASRDNTGCIEGNGEGLARGHPEVSDPSTGQIDLNCHPKREDMLVYETELSMTSHLETTNYLR
ncbi:hypothetical protein K1719_026522 [Acacia pycnantha]|nr:hypothetical protein K1719_026522 [Acacia pycnantha]